MGLNLGALIGAASTATSGYLAGQQRRRDVQYERDRQAAADAQAAEEHRLRMQALQLQLDQAQIPRPQAPISVAPGTTLYDPASRAPIYTAPERTPSPDKPASPVSLSPGQVLVDPATGRPIYRNPALPTGAGSGDGSPADKATEGERKGAGFYARAVDAAKALDGLPPESWGDAPLRALTPDFMHNFVQSNRAKDRSPSEMAFLTAVLRKDTGATINAQEYADGVRQYFERPGDTPEQRAIKRHNRQVAIQELSIYGGRAIPQGTGAPTDTSSTPPPPSSGKPMSPAAYQAARQAGYSDEEITAQGYEIPR